MLCPITAHSVGDLSALFYAHGFASTARGAAFGERFQLEDCLIQQPPFGIELREDLFKIHGAVSLALHIGYRSGTVRILISRAGYQWLSGQF